jgi:hypothetical protein
MKTIKVENIFNEEELNIFNKIISDIKIRTLDSEESVSLDDQICDIDPILGRLSIGDISRYIPFKVKNKINEIASNSLGTTTVLFSAGYALYNNKYGIPNLPPHFDGDTNDLIVNFQLHSNTSWDIGIGLDVYGLENNSAIVFNANTNIHWRPHKTFNNGEYVEMIFFRFYNKGKRTDYSYVPMNQTDDAFKEAIQFRNSL